MVLNSNTVDRTGTFAVLLRVPPAVALTRYRGYRFRSRRFSMSREIIVEEILDGRRF